MNQLLREKEENNMFLERELMALKRGQYAKGPDGLGDIKEFERLVMAMPQMERQVKNLISGKQINQGVTADANNFSQLGGQRAANARQGGAQGNRIPTVGNMHPIGGQQRKPLNTNADLQVMEMIEVANRLNEVAQPPAPVYNPMPSLKKKSKKPPKPSYLQGEDRGYDAHSYSVAGRAKQPQKGQKFLGPRDDNTIRSGGQLQLPQQNALKSAASSSNWSEQNDREYQPSLGFDLYFDFCSKMYHTFHQMRLVYTLQNVTTQVIQPLELERCDAIPDPSDNSFNCFLINRSNLLKGIPGHPSCNLIIEVQVPKAADRGDPKFVAYGWTLVNVFDHQRELNSGKIKLPLYQCPVNLLLDTRDINLLRPIPDTALNIRICNAQTHLDQEIREFDPRDGAAAPEYVTPEMHRVEDFLNQGIDLIQGLGSKEADDADQLEDEADEELEPVAMEDTKYQGKGVVLRVDQLSNYVPKTATTVCCTLYQGTKVVKRADNIDCQFLTTPRGINSVRDDPSLEANDDDKAYARNLVINEHVLWEQNFYKLLKQQPGKQDMNLIFEIYEQWNDAVDLEADNYSEQSKREFLREFNQNEIENNERLFAYAVLKINNEDCTLRYGSYDLNLFKPPINIRKRLLKDQLPYKMIKATLQLPEEHKDNYDGDAGLGYRSPSPQLGVGGDEPARPQGGGPAPAEPTGSHRPAVQEVPFVECNKRYIDSKSFHKPGQGIDLYIDQVRYLPDCATCTRLLIRGIDQKQTKVLNTSKVFMNVRDSTRMLQTYDFRLEIRPETQVKAYQSLDQTTFIEIVVETIDRSDMIEKIVGYAYFPLFLAPDGQPPQSTHVAKYHFNEGAYQLPIYYERVSPGTLVDLKSVLQLPKIRCATVLLRAFPCPQDQKGLNLSLVGNEALGEKQLIGKKILRLPQPYSRGAYNTQWCQSDRAEQSLYRLKQKRYDPPLTRTVAYLFQRRGTQMPSQESQVYQQLEQMFGKATLHKGQLSKKYENQYEPQYGFRLSVQRLHGLRDTQKKMVHFAVSSMAPPSRLYQAVPRLGPDVHVFKDQDMENSRWNSVQFQEVMNYLGLQGNEKLGAVVDIKAYNPKKQSLADAQSVGWAYFPLFKQVENEDKSYGLYVNSGLYQVPLFTGKVERAQLMAAQRTEDPLMSLQRERDLHYLEPTSVIIRIQDNQYNTKAPYGDFSDLDTSLLPGGKSVYKYLFNKLDVERSGEPTIQELHNIGPLNHQAKVKAALEHFYGVDYKIVGNS